jgi:hypothetical protein
MNTFPRRTKISGIAFRGLFMAALACALAAPVSARFSPPASLDEHKLGCLEETTLRMAGRDQVITLQDAREIGLVVEKYLAEEKPVMESSVIAPSTEAIIDCQGTVRLGAWILQQTFSSDKPELHLSYRVLTSEYFIVRQVISLALKDGQWKVAGMDRVMTRLRY